MSEKESYYVNESYELEGYYDQIKPNFEQQKKHIVNENENGRANPSQGSTCILLVLIVIICIICFVVLLLTILMFEKINGRCNCVGNEGQCTSLIFLIFSKCLQKNYLMSSIPPY